MSEPMFTATLYGTVEKAQAAHIEYLTRELAEAKAREAELDRLCDATYVAKGADAYNHACELTEQWDAERLKKGLAPIYGPGEGRSLCGWVDSIRQLLEDAEARAIPDGWVAVPVDVLDRFPEINPSNYDHDDACALNAWAVELVLSARPESPKDSGQQKPEVSYE